MSNVYLGRQLGLLAGLLLSASAAWAQLGAVRGTLQEAGTSQPVPFASVLLLRAPIRPSWRGRRPAKREPSR